MAWTAEAFLLLLALEEVCNMQKVMLGVSLNSDFGDSSF